VVHVSTRLRANAKRLRNARTPAEQRIWTRLRGRRFGDFKFRRQYPIAHYILDFYCPKLKLAIELDGQQHQTQWTAEYDSERTSELARRGITVLRIPNVLLIRDSLLVEEIIRAEVERLCR